MSDIVKILVEEMGFDPLKAKHAASLNSTLESCVDWLSEHIDDEIPKEISDAPSASSDLTQAETDFITAQHDAQAQGEAFEVDDAMLETLTKEFQIPQIRAIKGLYNTNNNLEAAINWIADHSGDIDIDSPEIFKKSATRVPLTAEQKKEQVARLEEKLAAARKKKAEDQKKMDKEQELQRIKYNKEMLEAKRLADEAERKRFIEETERKKLKDKQDREKILAQIEKDKRERAARAGKPIVAAEAEAEAAAKEDPYKKRTMEVKNNLRKLYASCRLPEGSGRQAMELAKKIVSNIVANPGEEKYRGVRVTNPTVMNTLTGKAGGTELMKAIGFVAEEGTDRIVLVGDVETEWLQICLKELDTAIAKGPFY